MNKDIRQVFQEKIAESSAREQQLRQNPALAKTPEMIAHFRKNGSVIFVFGLVISIATYMGYRSTGSVLIIALSASLVLTVGGLWMMITGTNPFLRLRK